MDAVAAVAETAAAEAETGEAIAADGVADTADEAAVAEATAVEAAAETVAEIATVTEAIAKSGHPRLQFKPNLTRVTAHRKPESQELLRYRTSSQPGIDDPTMSR